MRRIISGLNHIRRGQDHREVQEAAGQNPALFLLHQLLILLVFLVPEVARLSLRKSSHRKAVNFCSSKARNSSSVLGAAGSRGADRLMPAPKDRSNNPLNPV